MRPNSTLVIVSLLVMLNVSLVSTSLLPLATAEVHMQGLAPPGYQTYTVATIGGPRTLDPHRAYDTSSCSLITNVYETLIEFKWSYADTFIPELTDSQVITYPPIYYVDVAAGNFGLHITDLQFTENGEPIGPLYPIMQDVPAETTSTFGSYELSKDPNSFEITYQFNGETYTFIIPSDLAGTGLEFNKAYTMITAIGEPLTYPLIEDPVQGDTTIKVRRIPRVVTYPAWTISPDGLTYTFRIRTGVTFSNGNPLTPSDVEYSFERAMVRDVSGGPIWMFYVPIIGTFGSRYYPGVNSPNTPTRNAARAALGQLIENAFTSNGTNVFIHLIMPEGFFMQILAQTWSSILDEELMTRTVTFPGGATDSFDWDGTWGANGYEWWRFNDLYREQQPNYFGAKITPFDNPYSMMGTGPFTFMEHIPGEYGHRMLQRRVDYWGGWPAGALGTARAGQYPIPSRGYIDTYIEYQISDWTSRKLGLLSGTYDSVYVPRSYIAEVWQQYGVRCKYPQETLSVDALFFNFNVGDGITGQSPFVGTETWGTGLPLDAFSDLNLRKAFAYSFNQTKFLAEQWYYEAFQCATPIIPGLAPFTRTELIAYHTANRLNINLLKAEYYFKLAWGGVDFRSGTPDTPVLPEDPTKVTPGQVWNLGFNFDYTYNTGNVPRMLSGYMLAEQLLVINPNFHMGNIPVEWSLFAGDYLYSPSTNDRSIMPLWVSGWVADYADADNFARAFMYTAGYFSFAQSYSNPAGDLLIEQAASEPDPSVRKALYNQLNSIYLHDVPQIMGMVPLGRRWERDWVQGWYYNPLFGGSAASQTGESVVSNLYTIWKEALPREDIDANGKVEIKDLSVAAKAYGSYFVGMLPPMYPATPSTPGYPNPPWGTYTATWDSRADVNQDMKVDIKDLAKMAKLFGYQAPAWP